MKVTIEFNCDGNAFAGLRDTEELIVSELGHVMLQAAKKVVKQLQREPATVCDAPEEADLLRDSNGNLIGSVKVELPHEPHEYEVEPGEVDCHVCGEGSQYYLHRPFHERY